MTDTSAHLALLAAVDAYFETMFDADLERFDRLFAPTATLHGLRDGALRVLSVADYRGLLASNPSPKSRNGYKSQACQRSARTNTVHFTSTMAAVKSIRMMGCDARGRSG